jgi:hypothetical protein
LLALICLSAPGRAEPPKTLPVFEKDILPIFQVKCTNCHGAEKQRAGLDLRAKAPILKGGESGPAISVGSAEKSELWIKRSWKNWVAPAVGVAHQAAFAAPKN